MCDARPPLRRRRTVARRREKKRAEVKTLARRVAARRQSINCGAQRGARQREGTKQSCHQTRPWKIPALKSCASIGARLLSRNIYDCTEVNEYTPPLRRFFGAHPDCQT